MKIVCLDASTLSGADLSIFNEFGEFVKYDLTAKNEVIQRLKDADVAMVNKVVLDKDVLLNTNLKLILETATGLDNIDLATAKQKNIIVKNVKGYSTKSVVQHTFALIFAFLNQIIFYDKFSKENKWSKSKIFTDFSAQIRDLTDKTHAIIGFGSIGQSVAKISEQFGSKVVYYSTSGENTNKDYEQVDFQTALKADIISIHAPLSDKTRNLFNYENLKLLKDGVILVNLARGGIINEYDLAKILDEKDIKVGLDVLEHEPMLEDHPLLKIKNLDNLIITPHVAWASKESIQKLVKEVYLNLKSFVEEAK